MQICRMDFILANYTHEIGKLLLLIVITNCTLVTGPCLRLVVEHLKSKFIFPWVILSPTI